VFYSAKRTNQPCNPNFAKKLVNFAYAEFRTITHVLVDGNGVPILDANNNEIIVLDQNLDYNDLQFYLDGFNTKLKWIKNTCNKPFMIGETGFRSRLSNPSDA